MAAGDSVVIAPNSSDDTAAASEEKKELDSHAPRLSNDRQMPKALAVEIVLIQCGV